MVRPVRMLECGGASVPLLESCYVRCSVVANPQAWPTSPRASRRHPYPRKLRCYPLDRTGETNPIRRLPPVSVFANIHMPYTIEYFNSRVLAQIEGWPVGILADYARLVEPVSYTHLTLPTIYSV